MRLHGAPTYRPPMEIDFQDSWSFPAQPLKIASIITNYSTYVWGHIQKIWFNDLHHDLSRKFVCGEILIKLH